jgi:ribosomal protein S18 acetylase RimI-like enzyme
MNIRDATLQDINSIINLGKDVKEFDTTKEVVSFWPRHIIENCINSKNDILMIAEENNKLIGFIIIQNSITFKKAVIENIFVHKDYREKGIAQKLLQKSIRKLKELKCEYIATFVKENNIVPTNFYLKNKFNKGEKFIWLDYILSKEFSK